MHDQGLDYFQLRKRLLLCGLVFALFIAGCALYFFFASSGALSEPSVGEDVTIKFKSPPDRVDLTSLREGPFSLLDHNLYIPFPNLSDEIVLLGRNDRPDAEKKFLKVLLGLRGSKYKQELAPGERIFLNFNEKGMKFDRSKTPLWVRPIVEGGGVVLESGLELSSSMNERLVDETRKFPLGNASGRGQGGALTSMVNALRHVKGYQPDQLLNRYGGDRFRLVKGRPRFEFLGKDDVQMLFLSEGDVLSWKGGRWRLANCGAETRDHPIAQVVAVGTSSVTFKVWDQPGFCTEQVEVYLTPATTLNFRVEEVFARIRQRTLSSVSCKIAGKSAILRKGDWIIRTGSGWKVLKSSTELGQFLDYKVQGELFVFDGIEKGSSGAYFTGHLFDATRALAQSVRLPLMERKHPMKVEAKKPGGSEASPLFDDDFDDEFELEEMY